MTKKQQPHGLSVYATIFSGMYSFIFCMVLSGQAGTSPVVGGGLYLCGSYVLTWLSLRGTIGAIFNKKGRIITTVASILCLLGLIAFLTVYPAEMPESAVLLLPGVIFTILLREGLGRRFVYFASEREMPEGLFVAVFSLMHFLILIAGSLLLLLTLEGSARQLFWGGYAMTLAGEIYSQLKARADSVRIGPSPEKQELGRLREQVARTETWRLFDWMSSLLIVAMQLSIVVLYTFFAITGEQLLVSLGVALGVTLLSREITELWLRLRQRKDRFEASEILLAGLFLWVLGLLMLGNCISSHLRPDESAALLCLGLCTAGSTICSACMARLEKGMKLVAEYSEGQVPASYWHIRRASSEAAAAVGRLLALVALTVLYLAPEEALLRFQPVMLLPTLLVLLSAAVCAIRFPVNGRYIAKLRRALRNPEEQENGALRSQLDSIVALKRKRPFFIRMVIHFLRPFYRHRLQNWESVELRDGEPVIFLCNHGEFYGPVVATLFIPAPVRPWVISEIAVDKEEMAQYLYRFTISRQRWIPEKWKMPIARFIGPISVWAMDQLEGIPVFRNKPMQLMRTFRLSTEALQAGDNLLIFPENPNAAGENHGYERQGVGELFEGFAMIAPIYYKRTGKRCRFIPVFAHQERRTLTFGSPIDYDPENDSAAEQRRIAREAEEQLRGIYRSEEEKISGRTEKGTKK